MDRYETHAISPRLQSERLQLDSLSATLSRATPLVCRFLCQVLVHHGGLLTTRACSIEDSAVTARRADSEAHGGGIAVTNRLAIDLLTEVQYSPEDVTLSDVAYSRDGLWLATTSGSRLMLWNVLDLSAPIATATASQTLERVAFSPDATLIMTGGQSGGIDLYNMSLTRLRFNSGTHSDEVVGVGFTPDGTPVSCSQDGKLVVWDPNDLMSPVSQGSVGHVFAFALSNDGTRAAVYDSNQYKLKIYSITSLSSEFVSKVNPHGSSSDTANGIKTMSWSPDDQIIYTAGIDAAIRGWSSNRLTQLVEVVNTHSGNLGVGMIVVSPDGRRLASFGMDKTLRLWDTYDLSLLLLLENTHSSSSPSRMAFAPDGTRLATAASDKYLRIWDVSDIRPAPYLKSVDNLGLNMPASHDDIIFNPNGREIIALNSNLITNWDATNLFEAKNTFTTQTASLKTMMNSRDGSKLYVCRGGASPDVYEMGLPSFNILRTTQGLKNIESVAVSPDGSKLAFGENGGLSVWSTTGTSITMLHRVIDVTDAENNGIQHPIRSVDFSPDGTLLLSVGYDNVINLWNPSSSSTTPVRSKTAAHGDGAVGSDDSGMYSGRFNTDGTMIVTIAVDSKVRIWRTSDLTMLHEATGTHSSMNGDTAEVEVSSDRQYIISWGQDGKVAVYDWQANVLWTKVFAPRPGGMRGIEKALLSPDNTRVLTTKVDAVFRIDPWMTENEPRASLVTTSIERSSATSVSAAYGGGLSIQVGTVSVTNSTFRNCTAALIPAYVPSANMGASIGGLVSPPLPPSSPAAAPPPTPPSAPTGTATGGALFVKNATFDVYGSDFLYNAAVQGAALGYQSRPSFTSVSSLSLSTFDGNYPSAAEAGAQLSTVFAPTPIRWSCQLGQWSPETGLVPGDFSGCGYLCAAGSVGTTSSHVTPTCGGACPVGHFCPAGTVNPTMCNAGFRMPVTGAASADSCIPCSPGSHQPNPGQTGCVACDTGKFTGLLSATACSACPIGGFCGVVGAASASQTFEQCSAGTYNPDRGASSNTSCIGCPAGKANPVPGSTSIAVCNDCLSGSAAPNNGTAVCELCAPGKYTGDRGKTACQDCTTGYLCVLGSSAPQPCPGGTHANQTVLNSVGFLASLDDCIVCPTGTYCPVGSSVPVRVDERTDLSAIRLSPTNMVRAHVFADSMRAGHIQS